MSDNVDEWCGYPSGNCVLGKAAPCAERADSGRTVTEPGSGGAEPTCAFYWGTMICGFTQARHAESEAHGYIAHAFSAAPRGYREKDEKVASLRAEVERLRGELLAAADALGIAGMDLRKFGVFPRNCDAASDRARAAAERGTKEGA